MTLKTEAELVRLVMQEIQSRMNLSPSISLPGKLPQNRQDSQCHVRRAEAEGVCEIYFEPDRDRTLEKGYVPIGISARHCHVTQQQLEILFGKGATLTPMKPLRQPGQFAAKEVVSIIGPRGRSLENIRILGPCRDDTQVEVSQTDCIQLGVSAPVRPSGDHRETPGIIMIGPAGHLVIDKGVIRANRHIHLHTKEAALLELNDNDTVMVKIDGDKPVVYYDVQIRVSDKFEAEMHLDTDDANAVGLGKNALAQILKNPSEIPFCGKFRR